MNIRSVKTLPIITESISIEVIPTSKGGKQEDIAKISANIRLSQPLAEETSFIVPKIEGSISQKIYLPDGRKLSQDSLDVINVENLNTMPAQISSEVQNFIADPTIGNLKVAVETMATFSDCKTSSDFITVPMGTEYITFNYSKWIPQNEDGTFTLETLVPFIDFSLVNQAGAKAAITILMPIEINDVNNILEARWEVPNTNQPQALNKNYLDGRIILSQVWQYDPSVFVKYKY